jgi:hypothetical protein
VEVVRVPGTRHDAPFAGQRSGNRFESEGEGALVTSAGWTDFDHDAGADKLRDGLWGGGAHAAIVPPHEKGGLSLFLWDPENEQIRSPGGISRPFLDMSYPPGLWRLVGIDVVGRVGWRKTGGDFLGR